MSRESAKKEKASYLTPLISKLLSEPLSFKEARFPDSVTIKPNSYVKLTSGGQPADKAATEKMQKSKKMEATKSEWKQKRPRSVLEAVAMYTGKPEGKTEKKRRRSERRREREIKQLEQTIAKEKTAIAEVKTERNGANAEKDAKSQEDAKLTMANAVFGEEPEKDSDASDVDYQTADEQGESGSEGGSEGESEGDGEGDGEGEGEDAEESDDDDDDVEQLKQDLKRDMYEGAEEEHNSTETKNASEQDKQKESKDTEKDTKKQKNTGFFDLNEEENDRGSNGSKRIFKSWRQFEHRSPPVGLLNHGVTCYMNSAVQAMCHVPAIMHYFVDVHRNRYAKVIGPHSVTKVLADTACKMFQIGRKNEWRKVLYINPKKLIHKLGEINPMMSEWQQEDSHEYFMSLMSRLQEDSTPKGVKLNQSIIYDIFGGLLDQTVTCTNCGHISTTQQEFYDLSLGLESTRARGSTILDVEQMRRLQRRISANGEAGSSWQVCELLGRRIRVLEAGESEESEESEEGDEGEESEESKESEESEESEESDENEQGEDAADPQSGSIAGQATSADSDANSNPAVGGSGSDSGTPPIPKPEDQAAQKHSEEQKSQLPKYSVDRSIGQFFSPELIRTDKRDQSGYVCEKCKKRTTAVKISTISRAPETLTVHLKRFRFNGTSSMKVKAIVSYPDVLDLSDYTTTHKTPVRYRLITVILHEGRSVSSGHYVAHCRQPDGTWATYDDEIVQKIRPRTALNDRSAYVLIYSRLTPRDVPVVPAAGTGKAQKRVQDSKAEKRGRRKRRRRN